MGAELNGRRAHRIEMISSSEKTFTDPAILISQVGFSNFNYSVKIDNTFSNYAYN